MKTTTSKSSYEVACNSFFLGVDRRNRSLSSIAYFIDSALSNDPILGWGCIFATKYLKWPGVMEEVMPQSGLRANGLSSLGPSFLMHVKGSWTSEVFLALVWQICCLWDVYICPSGHSVSDKSSVNIGLPFYIHSVDWDTVIIEQLPSFFHYRPQLVVGWGLTQPAQADPWLMGTERNHISSVGSFENYISSSSKSESANNLCDGFAARI